MSAPTTPQRVNGNPVFPQITPFLKEKEVKLPRAVRTKKGDKFFQCQVTGIDCGDTVFAYQEPHYNKKGEILSTAPKVLCYSLPVLITFLRELLPADVFAQAYKHTCNFYNQKAIPDSPALNLIKQNPGIITSNPEWEQWRNVQLNYTLEDYAADHPPRKRKASTGAEGEDKAKKSPKSKKKVKLTLQKGVWIVGMSKQVDKAAKPLETTVMLVQKRRSMSKNPEHFEQVFSPESGVLLEYSTDPAKKPNPWVDGAFGPVIASTPKKYNLSLLNQEEQ